MADSILLVEDDRTSRRNLAAFLRLAGYKVYEAEDGEIALSLLTSTQFDVDGILITGTGSDKIKSRAKSLGAAYMEKPIQLRELEKTIEQRAKT